MNWEWRRVRRSFGKSRRKQIISRLQEWNTALQNCGLEKRENAPDSEIHIISLIQGRFDGRRTNKIRDNAQDAYETLRSGLQCDCCVSHRSNLQLNWHENKRFDDSTFNIAVAYPKSVQDLSPSEGDRTVWRSLSVSIEQPTGSSDIIAHNHSMATYSSAKSTTMPCSTGASTQVSQPKKSEKKKRVRIFGIQFTGRTSHRDKTPLCT